MVFMFPETRFRRPLNLSSETGSSTGTSLNYEAKDESSIKTKPAPQKDTVDEVLGKSSAQVIRAYHAVRGRPSKQQFSLIPKLEYEGSQVLFRDIVAPIQIFCFPIIIWAALSLGFAANCLLALNLTQSQVFAAPPYNFSPEQVGFVNFAFVVGGVIGLLTAGPVSDWVSMRATIRNGGIREAEMRLVALIPYLAICLVGMTVSVPSSQGNWGIRS